LDKLQEETELFRMACEEYDLWKTVPPSRFDSHIQRKLEEQGCDQTTVDFVRAESQIAARRGDINSPHEAVARSYQFREDYPVLFILSGPSGTGKSTWADDFQHVISLDSIREEFNDEGKVWQDAKSRLKSHLRQHQTVVWDATNLRRDNRRRLASIGYDYGAYVRIRVFCTPQSQAMPRNQSRSNAVPSSVIPEQYRTWHFPRSHEAHEVVYVDGEGQPMVRSLGGLCSCSPHGDIS
jgi:predicted kinase